MRKSQAARQAARIKRGVPPIVATEIPHPEFCICVTCERRRKRKIVHRDSNPRNNAIENLIADPPYASGRGLDVLLGAVRHPPSPDGYELVTIELSPQCFAAVREMHRTGLFGITERAVLEELVHKAVRLAIAEGWASRGSLVLPVKRRKR